MKIGLIGKKVGMSRIYKQDGSMVPVTVIHVAGNQVVQVKTKEKEGYSAIQLGYDEKKEKRCTKQLVCHFKKARPCKSVLRGSVCTRVSFALGSCG